jgi:hypothetical protein
VVTACTPPATDELEWTLANDTDQALQVIVRYRLDSTLMATPDQLAFVRQNQVDNTSVLDTLGHHRKPLRWLSYHHRQWYFVYSEAENLEYAQSTPAGAVAAYAQVDRSRGQLTYTLPPHSTQLLLTTGYPGPYADLEVAMTGLWLQQGATRQQVLPGQRFADVFHAEPTGREWGNNTVHRVTLRVRPGLEIKESFFRWLRRLRDL